MRAAAASHHLVSAVGRLLHAHQLHERVYLARQVGRSDGARLPQTARRLQTALGHTWTVRGLSQTGTFLDRARLRPAVLDCTGLRGQGTDVLGACSVFPRPYLRPYW